MYYVYSVVYLCSIKIHITHLTFECIFYDFHVYNTYNVLAKYIKYTVYQIKIVCMLIKIEYIVLKPTYQIDMHI